MGCYTTDPEIRWQYCDVPICGHVDEAKCEDSNPKTCGCSEVKQFDYRGTINTKNLVMNVKCGIVLVLIKKRELILIDTLELVLMRIIAATLVEIRTCRGAIQLILAKDGITAMSQLVAKHSHSSHLEQLIGSLSYLLYPSMKRIMKLVQNAVKTNMMDGILVHIYRIIPPKILLMVWIGNGKSVLKNALKLMDVNFGLFS